MKQEKEREALFKRLKGVLDIAEEKFSINNKKDHTRMKWGRLMIQAINSYGKLLEATQLDELAKEIQGIKEHIGMKQ